MQSIGDTINWLEHRSEFHNTSFTSKNISVLLWKCVAFQTIVSNSAGLTGTLTLEGTLDLTANPGNPHWEPYVAAPPRPVAGNGSYSWDIPLTAFPYFRVVFTHTAGSANFDMLTFTKV